MSNEKIHVSVLLKESIEMLNIKSGGTYIDCTLGEAGHSLEILKELGPEGALISIDRDQAAIDFVNSKYSDQVKDERWKIVKGNFSQITKLAEMSENKVNGILMDLGLSSRQLETDGRGFSYQKDDDLLDMRMDQSLSVTARDLIKVLREDELTKLFRLYGEERFAGKIARAIKNAPFEINTVAQFNSVVSRVMPAASKGSNKHPARRVYQALRIAVNDELNSLTDALESSFSLLAPDGRLVVISFHSLEDRIVKEFFKAKSDMNLGEILTKSPIEPSEEEVEANPRSRSAKLRVIIKTK